MASADMSMSKGVSNVEMSSPVCLLAFAVCGSPQNCRSTQHQAWRTMSLDWTCCVCQIDMMLTACNPWSTVQMGPVEQECQMPVQETLLKFSILQPANVMHM